MGGALLKGFQLADSLRWVLAPVTHSSPTLALLGRGWEIAKHAPSLLKS